MHDPACVLPLPQRRPALMFRASIAALLAFFCAELALAEDETLEPRPTRENILTPLLENYCFECHMGESSEGGMDLEKLNEAGKLLDQRRTWLRVLNRVRRGDMPPEDASQPSPQERAELAEWLDAELHSLDCSQPQTPGRVTLKRLNRVEYANTVSDLTGVELDVSELLPRDELGHGFDNNGDVLSLSPLLLEKYLDAAEEIAAKAIPAPESILEPSRSYSVEQMRGGHLISDDTRLLYTNGSIEAKVKFPSDGRYFLRVKCYATQAGDPNELAEMRVELAGEPLSVLGVAAEEHDPHTYVIPLDAKKGKQKVAVTFTNDLYEPDAKDHSRRDRNLFVLSLTVVGPVGKQRMAASKSLLSWEPSASEWSSTNLWREPTRKQIERLVSRAFRRSANEQEIDRFMNFVAAARTRGETYQQAMQLVLQATLVSPKFLFRNESPAGTASIEGETHYRLSDYQLATRLSYFLTLSMPDEQLRQSIREGQFLRQIHEHIDRLLRSERSDTFLRHFGEQWLETRKLEDLERDQQVFPEFEEALAQSMRDETFLFLRHLLSSEKPLQELLTAEYSFLDARLANHYGVQWPAGEALDSFQRIALPPERRAGLLTHGSVLSVASLVDRTSPVLRGKWILEHLLADPPPDPPPGVSELPETHAGEEPQSLRAQLELHRSAPGCSVCHERMDPLGFALENYDALGKFREQENNLPIDSSGKLPDGREFAGALGLRDVLLEDFDTVREALAAQLLTYALGRGLEYHDECAVKEIAATTKQKGDTLVAMIHAVVDSAPFQMREERPIE